MMVEPRFSHDSEFLARLVARNDSTLTFASKSFCNVAGFGFINPSLIGNEVPQNPKQALAFGYHQLAEAFCHYFIHRTSYRAVTFLCELPCIYPMSYSDLFFS
jgi:hypothetical protein